MIFSSSAVDQEEFLLQDMRHNMERRSLLQILFSLLQQVQNGDLVVLVLMLGAFQKK
jgi:hypothetical protein